MKFLNASILICLLTGTAFAQPINYQGRLSEKSGTNVNGTRNFTLRIFDAKTGGKQIYEENVGAVDVTEGAYSFNFGETGKSVVTPTETIAFSDGEKQIFNYTAKNPPVLGEIKISGGGYSWTEAGSSDATKFTATANKNSGAVSAIFLTGAPEAGQKISIAYDHNSDGVMGALSRGGQAWLELVVGGETLSPRERLVAVPFALYAKNIANYRQPESLLIHEYDKTQGGWQLPYSTNVKDAKDLYLYIPKNTKSLRLKMIFHRQDYPNFGFPTCRLKLGDQYGIWGLSGHSDHDELTIDIGGISGWKEMTIQVKDFPTSQGVPVIKHLMVYTKNN